MVIRDSQPWHSERYSEIERFQRIIREKEFFMPNLLIFPNEITPFNIFLYCTCAPAYTHSIFSLWHLWLLCSTNFSFRVIFFNAFVTLLPFDNNLVLKVKLKLRIGLLELFHLFPSVISITQWISLDKSYMATSQDHIRLLLVVGEVWLTNIPLKLLQRDVKYWVYLCRFWQ